eukprot:190949_1
MTDSTSFINRHGSALLLNITLYPQYHTMDVTRDKPYNFRETKGFGLLDEWYIEERDQRVPFGRIVDDYALIDKWKHGTIKVSPNAYTHPDRNIKSNRDALKAFKAKIRMFCGGSLDKQHHATTASNYMFIDSKRLNGSNSNPPSKVCIQCGLSLQCLPLMCIGEAIVFVKDKEGDAREDKTYKVYLYYVAMICENYPLCTFPRSRDLYDKHWIKCAWFNDINGKEYIERNGKPKRKRKRDTNGMKEVSSLLSPPAFKKHKASHDVIEIVEQTNEQRNHNKVINLTMEDTIFVSSDSDVMQWEGSNECAADTNVQTNDVMNEEQHAQTEQKEGRKDHVLDAACMNNEGDAFGWSAFGNGLLSLPDLEYGNTNSNHVECEDDLLRTQWTQSPTSPLSTPEVFAPSLQYEFN